MSIKFDLLNGVQFDNSPTKMIKVKALRGFGIGGGVFAIPGEIISLQEADARLRVMQGKAIIYNEVEKVTASTEITDKGGKKK